MNKRSLFPIVAAALLALALLMAGCAKQEPANDKPNGASSGANGPDQNGPSPGLAPDRNGETAEPPPADAGDEVAANGETGPWQPAISYKKGEKHTYDVTITSKSPGMPGTQGEAGKPQTQTEKRKLSITAKEVGKDGALLQFSALQEAQKGATTPPQETSWTARVNKNGKVVDKGEVTGDRSLAAAFGSFESIEFPGKPVKKGDKWTVKRDNPLKETQLAQMFGDGVKDQISFRCEMLGMADWQGKRALKVRGTTELSLKADVPSGPPQEGQKPTTVQLVCDVESATTYFVDPETGQILGVTGTREVTFAMPTPPTGDGAGKPMKFTITSDINMKRVK